MAKFRVPVVITTLAHVIVEAEDFEDAAMRAEEVDEWIDQEIHLSDRAQVELAVEESGDDIEEIDED